jgi:predicted RNase H-like HicB family nuclease
MSETEIIFSFEEESPEGGYMARAIGHSIFTQAETMDELRTNVNEAVARHFGDRTPLPVPRLVARPKSFVLGSAKGEFTVPDDFNDPDPEIEDLFYNGPLLPK